MENKIVMIPLGRLLPHPDNPRKDVGDVTELSESLKANGILQNLTVVPNGENYTVIIGHRRLAAAKKAGLLVAPCVIVEMSPKEQVATMLTENLQRADLTVYEQAQSFNQLSIDFGMSVAEIVEMSGFSESTVRRRIKMGELDKKTLAEVSDRQISMADFDRLAQIRDVNERNKLLHHIGTSNFDYNFNNTLRDQTVADRMSEIRRQLKSLSAKELKDIETYSSKYENALAVKILEWDGKTELVPEKLKKVNFFWNMNKYSGTISFYTEREKAQKTEKSEAQKKKEKRLADAHAQVRALNKTFYELRHDFVYGLKTVDNKTLTHALSLSLSLKCMSYLGSSINAMCDIIGVSRTYMPDKQDAVIKACDELSGADMVKLAYEALGDGESLGYATAYTGKMPSWRENSTMSAIYAFLDVLGYEMCDDEKLMQSGTHEVFKEDK